MKTTVVLIRHGLTDWNMQGRWQGHMDVPLNNTGRAQAEALARRLAGWSIDALYASDLRRAAETAAIVGRHLALQTAVDPIWRERDVGAFQGLTSDEIRHTFPQEWAAMQRGIVSPPQGEDNDALVARGRKALGRLLAAHAEGVVAVVSHGGLLHATLLHVLGLSGENYGRFSLRGNTGISIVECTGSQMQLVRLNDTSHLETTSLAAPF